MCSGSPCRGTATDTGTAGTAELKSVAGNVVWDVDVSTLASGYSLSVPVLVINGARPGPRVGVSAMIHGDEIEGMLIVRELWRTIDPSELAGSLWMMPVANPLAMEAISRNTPIDMLDMNRNFPGAPDGWLSEQQAHAITNGFISRIDCLVDINQAKQNHFIPLTGHRVRAPRKAIAEGVNAYVVMNAAYREEIEALLRSHGAGATLLDA